MAERRKKGELTLLAEQLDKELRKAALARDGERCCHCGWTAVEHADLRKLHTSHVIPKREGHGLRWDIRNVIILCYRCHLEKWHKDPLLMAKWFQETYPDRYEYLMERHDLKKTLTADDRRGLINFLRMKAKQWQRSRVGKTKS